MVTRKQRAGEIQESIRRVLLDSRDPFQVSGEPTAQDEYDGCIAGVYRLLVSGAPPEQVAQHLRQIADEWLGPAVGVGDADLRSLANSVHSRCDLGARVRLPNQGDGPDRLERRPRPRALGAGGSSPRRKMALPDDQSHPRHLRSDRQRIARGQRVGRTQVRTSFVILRIGCV
jgi:hypothetical protein